MIKFSRLDTGKDIACQEEEQWLRRRDFAPAISIPAGNSSEKLLAGQVNAQACAQPSQATDCELARVSPPLPVQSCALTF